MISEIMKSKLKIKQLEDSLLLRLTSSEKSLVEDEELIEALHTTDKTTKEIYENMKCS